MTWGTKGVICKAGADGAYLATGTQFYHIPAFSITPVDTTAAGDAFNGALAVAIAEKRPLSEALRWANAAGALAATGKGAQSSLPSKNAVEYLFYSGFNSAYTTFPNRE